LGNFFLHWVIFSASENGFLARGARYYWLDGNNLFEAESISQVQLTYGTRRETTFYGLSTFLVKRESWNCY